jgi:hypothetical protein
MDQELGFEERTSGLGAAPADGQPGVWSETGLLNVPRMGHTATLLQNGMVLAHGGDWRSYVNGVFTDHGNLSSAELFNPATGIWTLAPSAFYERFGHTATLLPNGKVLVVGGIVGGSPTANTELFDSAQGQWFATGRTNTPRLDHAATALADGRVLVVGGYSASSPAPERSAEIYDPTTQVWTRTGDLGHARVLPTATLLLDARVLVVGGGTTSLAELYDPATGQWLFTAGPSQPGGKATRLHDGKVVYVSSRRVELFDPAQLTWRVVGSLNVGRDAYTATLLSNGKVLVAGGFHVASNGDRVYRKSAELFDPTTLKWTLTAPPNAGRASHTATLLRPPATDPAHQDRVLIAGGNDGPTLENSINNAELCLLGEIVRGPPLPVSSAGSKSTR